MRPAAYEMRQPQFLARQGAQYPPANTTTQMQQDYGDDDHEEGEDVTTEEEKDTQAQRLLWVRSLTHCMCREALVPIADC
jgi:hypothetical protein